ncbi:hypothetical protein CABS03_04500 [Colletotrichum abscissum]|uniref:Uncharacterized protein n=1 Tax=Colletotrichum abscissum TaxID=1671311 RepID=A0A9P9XCH0_9PEZI|nr:hypothetical protein CABS02_08249 [Colletotrichum abscissum]
MGCLANVFRMAGSGNYREFSPIASPVARPPVFAHRLAQASHERQCQIRRPALGHGAKQVALESRRTHLQSCTASSVAPRSRVVGSWRRVLFGSVTIHNAIARRV